jgi:hypothetical protein
MKKQLWFIVVGGLTILAGAVFVYYASVWFHVNFTQPPISNPTAAPSSTQTGPENIPTPPSKLYREQEGSLGANTFADPYGSAKQGDKIQAGAWMEVSCKVLAKTFPSASPDGYWYRIESSPWNNAYYAVANTFMNGDPWGGPYKHYTDFKVPNCEP